MPKNRKKRKDYILSFRVSEKDYFELLKIADENQVSISEIIRDAIRNYEKKTFVINGNNNIIICGNNNIIGKKNKALFH